MLMSSQNQLMTILVTSQCGTQEDSPSFIVAKGAFLHFFLQLLSLFLRRTVCLSACVPKLYPHIKSLTTNVKKILVKIVNFQHIKICSLFCPGHVLLHSTTSTTDTSTTDSTRITNAMATFSDYLMKYFNGFLAVLLV